MSLTCTFSMWDSVVSQVFDMYYHRIQCLIVMYLYHKYQYITGHGDKQVPPFSHINGIPLVLQIPTLMLCVIDVIDITADACVSYCVN